MTLWLVFTPGGVRHAYDKYVLGVWLTQCGRRGSKHDATVLAPINRHRAVPCRQCLAEIERRIRVSQAIVDEMREDLR